MIADEIAWHVAQQLRHVPTADQQRAITVFARFLADRSEQSVMVMRGAAGTGKTTLASAMVRTLRELKQKVVLMAPTGRAAKVFAQNSSTTAFTIHRRIYRQRTAGDLSSFNLNFNTASDTLFLVDEASMVANTGFADSMFGEGRLLDDLVRFVYNSRNCRLMLIGDQAQLPPVGEEESPALSTDVLRSLGLRVYECSLDEVLRQSHDSGILWNATRIRSLTDGMLPRIRFTGFADISIVPGDELIEQLNSSYSAVGIDDTIVVTRSNKRCNIYNIGIRNTILDREEQLCRGDQLMVVKNNYYWKAPSLPPTEAPSLPPPRGEETIKGGLSFLANGDRARVLRVRNVRELYGFHFADVALQLPDYDDRELQATVLLDTLAAEAPALTREQQQTLFSRVMDDYADIPQKGERIRRLKEDAYFNALQVKYAYAVTCHKAQGGQWAHVYVDQGYMTDDMLTPDYIHWLYTAFTRATEKLFLVNWPRNQVEDEAATV